MTTPVHRQLFNIRASFFKAVQDRIDTPNTTPSGRAYESGWVDYEEADYDNSSHNYWLRVEFLDEQAGQQGHTFLQFACFARESASDLKGELLRMQDLVLDAMNRYGGMIKIYNFADPSSPVVVPKKYLGIQDSQGRWGRPDSVSNGAPPDGVMARVITYRMSVIPSDHTGAKQDYTRE